jgi:hypothetical protein
MYAMEVKRRDILKQWDLFVNDKDIRIFENWIFFIGPLLTLPMLAVIANFRDPHIRPLLLFVGLLAFLNLFQLVLYPYHLGPLVAVIFTLLAYGLCRIYRALLVIRPAAARVLALTLPICLLVCGAMKREADEIGLPLTYWERATEPHGAARASIQRWLSARSRKQLVIVHYAPDHSPNQEWVYNGADIDGSKVVWAREMDTASDARLLDYFKDREVWLLQADIVPQHVLHYVPDAIDGSEGNTADACDCRSKSQKEQ